MTNNTTRDNPASNTEPDKTAIACLGSSSTAGKGQAFDWIGELKRRPQNERYCFRNFGVGGDLAYNALQRLPAIIASRPGIVIVWVGGNDVLAQVSAKVRWVFQRRKHLPAEPSPERFRVDLQAITRRLKDETSARVALCSLPPIGEDASSADLFQSQLNRGIEQFSAIIKDVAQTEHTDYIPLYEAIWTQLKTLPCHAFTSFRFHRFYRDAFRILILGKSPDEVAKMNGWSLHTDGVHLNSRGGMIVADLVQEFLNDYHHVK